MGALGMVLLALLPSRARRALPWEATDICEHYWDDGFQGDFLRCLKAKVSEEGFHSYVRALGLCHVYSTQQHKNLPLTFRVGCDEPWWNPSDSLDDAYFSHTPGKEHFALAKHENGHAYFVGFAW
jgi:hypothetical protein